MHLLARGTAPPTHRQAWWGNATQANEAANQSIPFGNLQFGFAGPLFAYTNSTNAFSTSPRFKTYNFMSRSLLENTFTSVTNGWPVEALYAVNSTPPLQVYALATEVVISEFSGDPATLSMTSLACGAPPCFAR